MNIRAGNGANLRADAVNLPRRGWLMSAGTIGLAIGWAGVGVAQNNTSTLVSSQSLARELAQAHQQGLPLVVMVSLAGCPYCKIARENYLLPLVRAGKAAVVQVDMMSVAKTQDFAGATVTHEQLVERWKIKIAPTLLFVGKDGMEVAERLVGGYLPDFYGAYLADRLVTAQKGV